MSTLIILSAKYLYLLAVILLVVYFFKLSKEKRKSIVLYSVIDLPLVYAAGLLAGKFYNNPRPFVSEHIAPLIFHAANNGFPSDHVIFTAALASIIFPYNRKLGIIMYIIALLVGVARVYAGIHHWIDIVGAMLIAIFVSYIIYRLSKKILYI